MPVPNIAEVKAGSNVTFDREDGAPINPGMSMMRYSI